MSTGNICVGDYIKKWYGTKPNFVTYGGIANKSEPKKNDLVNKSQLDIIFVGRLQVDLGIRAYLESFEFINKKNINYEFQVYGDGQLRDEMQKFGIVHGFVDSLDVLIKKADIVFSSSYLTMLQALSARKIVIAVYENELKKDYLKNSPFAKYIYICSNAKEIAGVVEKIAIEPWKSQSMLENGHRWANSQSWGNVANTYLKLWKI